MEKRTPHFRLEAIQATVASKGRLCFTASARMGADAMGLAPPDSLAAIAGLTARCFRKSMTTYADHRVWQDVYIAQTPAGDAYVKFTMRSDGSVVISFKRVEP
ncbi:MAG: type II toxin-antitoxin system MqsR family toxin [Xanthomonadales bacterium]|jgi:motility quorum-sensing regulator/GCU-specific mRNA interferase toxin|nr:type II toxin-antitoxin system MqsR family toxin [Xanthomonadales bacterium]MBK7146927.1 type II toxin-antitoxin system MqsR family toxin [Xanthomonadales bacterium]